MVAATGTASITPRKPNAAPPANSAKITQTAGNSTRSPEEAGIDHVALQDLSDHQHAADHRDAAPMGELRQRQPDRGHAAGDRANIGNERQQAGRQSDDQPRSSPATVRPAA